jgi:ABC-type uncharacterized transport system substrate-binding protein
MRKFAAELAALAPDVILAVSSPAVSPLLQVTRTIPIVFGFVADPVGAGYVESLARPGANATGFTGIEYSFAGKWLELMKEIAPPVKRVAVLRDSAIAAGPGQFGVLQAFAPMLGLDLRPMDLRDAGEIERSIIAFAQGGAGGLIVTGSPAAPAHGDLIVALAARHRLPAVYSIAFFCRAGGLICYGSHPQRREAGRHAGAGAGEIRTGDQPQDREGTRHRGACDPARPRRRGDRIASRFAALHAQRSSTASMPRASAALCSVCPGCGAARSTCGAVDR